MKKLLNDWDKTPALSIFSSRVFMSLSADLMPIASFLMSP